MAPKESLDILFLFQRGCSGETIRKISREAPYNLFLALELPCPTVMIIGLIIEFFISINVYLLIQESKI